MRLAERLVLWISAPSGAVSDSHAKADLANSFRAGAVMRSPSTAWGSITPRRRPWPSVGVSRGQGGRRVGSSSSDGGASVPKKTSQRSGVFPLRAWLSLGCRGQRYGSDVVAVDGRPPRMR